MRWSTLARVLVALALVAPVARAQAETGSDPQATPPPAEEPAAPAPEDVEEPDAPIDDEPAAEPPAPAPVIRPRPRPATPPVPKTGKLEKTEHSLLGGKHWRIRTEAGALHVWVPPGYDRATAGTVVYVHGYWTDADGAWKGHDLARQFKASGQNAIFIVPDAPSNNGEQVKWRALTDLRRAITRANIKLPDGPTVVVGHSGAFRTVMQWVDHKAVAQVILLDALYGGQTAFDDFIGTGKRAQHHKLIVVGADTAAGSAAFAKKYPFAVVRERMPASSGDFKKREKSAKLLYIQSQYGHMQIVTSGKVLPVLLRLTPLKHR